MKKHLALVTVAAAATLAAVSSPATAEPIKQGTFALGAERLTGFYHAKVSIGDTDDTYNRITVLAQSTTGPYDLPRIGLDYFVIDGLSIGGTLALMNTSRTVRQNVRNLGSASVDLSETDFLFAPRVGYALMFASHVGIWPRGGFSYYLASADIQNGDGTQTTHYFSLDIEAPFLFTLADNFAITAGPIIDVSLDGSQKSDLRNAGTVRVDASYAAFGIAAGLLVEL